jgi:molybdenum cofactor synthesis domain-containing protein
MAPRIGILTVSDTRTEATDLSGPATEAALTELGFSEFERGICRDDVARIQAAVLSMCESCKAVFTTGGTGFAPRDVTPEATLPLLDRLAPSLAELMRLKGLEKTPMSHLSRAVAGMRGPVLIVNLPGSPSGARDGIAAIGHLLPLILEALVD